MRERDLTFEERATWGACPVCNAQDREWCDRGVGLQLKGAEFQSLSAREHAEGVHLARLNAAPKRVREVPV